MVHLSPSQRSDFVTDQGVMVGWFANAIVAGHDEGRRLERSRGFHELIREIAYQSAGAGSGAVMREAPNVIMPSQEISSSVDKILKEFGIMADWERHDQLAFGDGGRDSINVESPRTSSKPPAHRSPGEDCGPMEQQARPDGLLREHREMEPE
jgi:hypothetical protein